MNERILELAKQAGLYDEKSPDEVPEFTASFEKFAKLIVRECAEVAERTGSLNEADYEGEMIADAIKEHFGVEE